MSIKLDITKISEVENAMKKYTKPVFLITYINEGINVCASHCGMIVI